MKNKLKYLPTLTLTLMTVFAGAVLASAGANADVTRDAVVNVLTACSFTNSSSSYTTDLSIAPGGTEDTEEITTRPTFGVTCNANNGFSVNAIGFSPDATHPDGADGNTSMYGSYGTISTGTSGTNSYWAFKVSSASATGSTATIESPYSGYSNIPSSTTPIVSFSAPSTPGTHVTGNVRTDYKVHVNPSLPAGTYTGKVKYTIVTN